MQRSAGGVEYPWWQPTASRTSTSDLAAVAGRPAPAPAPPPFGSTVADAVEAFSAAAESGGVLNRSGRPYLPSALRDVRGALRHHVVPALGQRPLRDVRREDIQALVDRLGAEGLSESRIRSVVSALRALYGYAIERGDAAVSPADTLSMPAVGHARPSEDWTGWDDPSRDEATDVRPPPARAERPRDDAAFRPVVELPATLLKYALRSVFVLFVVAALVALLGSA